MCSGYAGAAGGYLEESQGIARIMPSLKDLYCVVLPLKYDSLCQPKTDSTFNLYSLKKKIDCKYCLFQSWTLTQVRGTA